ncbi:MAG: leucine-rich repeat protein [Bacteroidaceae bacterium]|nr:leucine-rich repeat protein [Bacteroidaceae bacterium]
MKSYLLKTVLLLAVLCSATAIHAHDFEAVNKDGVTIYYKIISTTDKTCEVTYKGSSSSEYNSEYSGVVNIPETATYSSISFKVTSIGKFAFSYCRGLTSITIPNSVTSIGGSAFSRCSGLTSVTIGNSVTSIGSSAFEYCIGLTSVTIGNSVSSIGNHAFSNCIGLTSVTIGNSVTSIGSSAFEYCIGLTSVTIPNSVTSIDYYAFSGCSGLTSVTIGSSVKRINQNAFAECSALTEVVSNIETPFNISSNCFPGLVKMNATLYVPKGTKELYQATEGWDFVNIDDGLVYYQLTLTANEGGSITYNGEKIENVSASFEIREGKTATITVEPWDKYELTSLKMNGMNVKKYMVDNTFTTDEIDSDVEIVATFDLINPYITITPSAELQTFCSEKNLNFSEVNGLTAYIVTGYKPSANELLLTPVLEVPAGTGVLLKGDVGATYKVPFENSDYNYNNNLVGVLSDTEVITGYVFDGVFKAVGGSAIVPANSAYLVLPAATNAGVSQLNLCITDGPAVKGDVNGDGRVDITDVVSLVNIVLGN